MAVAETEHASDTPDDERRAWGGGRALEPGRCAASRRSERYAHVPYDSHQPDVCCGPADGPRHLKSAGRCGDDPKAQLEAADARLRARNPSGTFRPEQHDRVDRGAVARLTCRRTRRERRIGGARKSGEGEQLPAGLQGGRTRAGGGRRPLAGSHCAPHSSRYDDRPQPRAPASGRPRLHRDQRMGAAAVSAAGRTVPFAKLPRTPARRRSRAPN